MRHRTGMRIMIMGVGTIIRTGTAIITTSIDCRRAPEGRLSIAC